MSWWLFNWQIFLVWVCLLALPKLKGIVHPKMKILCSSAYPKGIQDVGDFVSSVEHKQRFLTRTVAVCQSYNGSQWYSRLWERKKTYTDKTKLNPAARGDTLRSKDTKRSVCARNWTVFISVFLPLIRRPVQMSRARHEPQGLIWFCLFFFSLKAVSTIDCHYMTDRLQRFELKILICVLLKKQPPTSWMPWG